MASEIPTPFENQLALEQVNLRAPGAQEVNFGEQLQSAIATGETVVQAFDRFDERKKAKAFEEILKGGEAAMEQYVQQLKAEGFDVSNIPDSKIYGQSQQSISSWYKLVNAGIEKQKAVTRQAATTQAGVAGLEQAAGGDVPGGIQTAVKGGALPVGEGFSQIEAASKTKALQEFINPTATPIATPTPTGEVVPTDVSAVSPVDTTSINSTLKGLKLKQLPKELESKFKDVAAKTGAPEGIVIGLVARESGFNAKAKNPNSSATGYGQFITSTGKAVLKQVIAKGLLPKGTKYDPKNGDQSLLLTAFHLKDNIDKFGSLDKALLAHRIGPGKIDAFLAGEKIIVGGKDITADVTDWMSDIKTVGGDVSVSDVAAITPTPTGPDLETVAGIESEKERLSTDPRFSGSTEVAKRLQVLEQKKDDLAKKEAKAGKKDKGRKRDLEVADTIDLVLSLSEQVAPSGKMKGFLKKAISKVTDLFPEIDKLEAFKGGLAGQIAKGIGGESGRLTDQDRTYALSMMPDVKDSDELRDTKFRVLKAVMERLRNEDLSQEERSKALIDAVRGGGKEIGRMKRKEGKKVAVFPEENLPDNPTDEEVIEFLEANGKKVNPQSIEIVKKSKGGGGGDVAPSVPTPATPTSAPQGGAFPLNIKF